MNYKLVRMKRKTLSITVADGEVTVKAPKSTTVERIESFVAQKSDWIQKKLDEQARRTAFLGGVLDYSMALLCGNMYYITLTEAYKRIKVENGTLYVPVKYADENARKRAIAAWYKREAGKFLEQRLKEISAATGLTYKSFALTNARTKWGSCDGQCNIRLNWRLLMLDGALVDYVIVHELSHTLHHDHSSAFWAQVGAFYKNYKAARKALKTYAALTTLYR